MEDHLVPAQLIPVREDPLAARNDVTLQQLRYFVAAARFGSMTKAADDLLVAQSAVSSSIAVLEKQLASQLFIRRRSKGLMLTSDGERFLRNAQALLSQLDESIEEARGDAKQYSGVVRLACFVTLTPFVVPRLLERLEVAHPELEVHVSEVDTQGAREALQSGSVDLAVGYDFGFGEDVEARVIGHAEPYVLLSSSHPLGGRSEIALAELAGENFVLLDIPQSRDYFLGLLTDADLTPRIRHRSRNYETIRALVARGHGFSILNQRASSNTTYDGGEIVTLPIAGSPARLTMVVARMKGAHLSSRMRAVADALREGP